MVKKMDTADILLVEDNLTDAELTMRALKKKDLHLNVIHFEDGAEALKAIFSRLDEHTELNGKHFPQLILLDLKLPGMHGKEILRELKGNEKTRMIPVVILTSSNQQSDVTDCYQLGSNAYIVKPLDFEEYMSKVSKAAFFWMHVNYMPDEFS